MGSLEAALRHRLVMRSPSQYDVDQPHLHRDPLPAIGFLGKDSGFTPKHPSSATASSTPLMSPNVMYTGQPLPYAYAPTNGAPSQTGYISPSEARRAIEDEKDNHTPRQSLPSIHEALGNDSLPYPAPTSAPPTQTAHPAPPSHTHIIARSTEGPSGPPNPFNGPGSMMREPGFPHQPQMDASRSSLTSINTQDSRNASLHSLSTGKSPTQSAKTGITSVGSQNSTYEYSAPTSAGSVASPNGYSHFPPNYTFQSTPGGHSYQPAPYDNRPYVGAQRVDEVKGGFVGRPVPPHSDSVKRHLDVYDVEQSLNEV
jgi:hypothetical protein